MFGQKKIPPTPEERAAANALEDKRLENYCRWPDSDIEAKARRPVVQEIPDLWCLAQTYLSEGEKRSERKSRRETATRPLRKTKSTKKVGDPPVARLSQQDEDDLRFFWETFPSLCGLRSNWQATVEAMGECAKCGAARAR